MLALNQIHLIRFKSIGSSTNKWTKFSWFELIWSKMAKNDGAFHFCSNPNRFEMTLKSKMSKISRSNQLNCRTSSKIWQWGFVAFGSDTNNDKIYESI